MGWHHRSSINEVGKSESRKKVLYDYLSDLFINTFSTTSTSKKLTDKVKCTMMTKVTMLVILMVGMVHADSYCECCCGDTKTCTPKTFPVSQCDKNTNCDIETCKEHLGLECYKLSYNLPRCSSTSDDHDDIYYILVTILAVLLVVLCFYRHCRSRRTQTPQHGQQFGGPAQNGTQYHQMQNQMQMPQHGQQFGGPAQNGTQYPQMQMP
jgi:hypothetical protein